MKAYCKSPNYPKKLINKSKPKYILLKSATELQTAKAVEWLVMPDTWQSGNYEQFRKWCGVVGAEYINKVYQMMEKKEIKIMK